MKSFSFSTCLLITLLNSCSNSNNRIDIISKDSVEKEILLTNERMISAVKKGDKNEYQSYCEDSLIFTYDQEFTTSSYQMSQGLVNGEIVPAHDFTIRVYSNTAILSFLQTTFEVLNADTIFHSVRTTKTFTYDNNRWKLAAISTSLVGKNFNKPISNQPTNFKGFSGIYKWTDSKIDSVFVKDGKLYDAFSGEGPQWNFAINDSTYMTENDLGKVYFNKNSKGEVIGYTYERYDGQKLRIPKVK